MSANRRFTGSQGDAACGIPHSYAEFFDVVRLAGRQERVGSDQQEQEQNRAGWRARQRKAHALQLPASVAPPPVCSESRYIRCRQQGYALSQLSRETAPVSSANPPCKDCKQSRKSHARFIAERGRRLCKHCYKLSVVPVRSTASDSGEPFRLERRRRRALTALYSSMTASNARLSS